MGRAEAPVELLGIDGALILLSVAVATIGIVLAWRYFGIDLGVLHRDPRPDEVRAIAGATPATRFLYRASLNKWWFDELNDLLFIRFGGRVVAAACLVVRPNDHRRRRERDRGDLPRVRRRAAPGPDRPGPELRAGHRHRPHRHGRLLSRDREAVGR